MRKFSIAVCCAWLLAILSSAAAADDARPWKLIVTTGSKYYNAYRCNTATGQCWKLLGNNQWQPFTETGAVPAATAGTYDFEAVELLSNDNWVIMRCNSSTGQTWTGADTKWTECTVQQ